MTLMTMTIAMKKRSGSLGVCACDSHALTVDAFALVYLTIICMQTLFPHDDCPLPTITRKPIKKRGKKKKKKLATAKPTPRARVCNTLSTLVYMMVTYRIPETN